ncbi:MAG: hypothetical protein R3335_06195, partial [Anaerolineales bacterium]|nr:hypothetical protein [Anaerolineales bacterium]
TVGERSRAIASSARNRAPRLPVAEFSDSGEALTYLEPLLQDGDVVLVKGSRGMNMDLIVSSLEAG